MTSARLLSYCESQRGWAVDIIRTLASLESPSDDKQAVDRCGVELHGMLGGLGGRVERRPQAAAGDHLRAEFGSGGAQVLLLGHFDTVWPVGQIERMPVTERNGRLHGPGVYDMKAGIGMAMLAVRALLETGTLDHGRVTMLWTTDEEVGSSASRALIEDEARASAAVLVFEPATAAGALKTRRKGCGDFELLVEGRSAHAGVDPEKGISATAELAHQILAVCALQDLARGVSVNVGVIEGGSRTNVVPERARALVDVRAPSVAEAARLEAEVRRLVARTPGARLEVRGGFGRPPMERTPGVAWLFEEACAVGRELGHEVTEGSTGGGSDGNFTAALGVPTLDGLGALGDGAHALHEHVRLDQLAVRAALAAGLIHRILSRPAQRT